ncbi:MAG: hypothetical protein AB7O43_02315 [Hyphomicrobiaceae bacterium]
MEQGKVMLQRTEWARPTRGDDVIVRLLPIWFWAVAVSTGLLLAASFRWGIVHDASLMFYIGREVADGARPVADVFDMNMPLIHWLHALIYGVIGLNEPAWRLIDLAAIGAIMFMGCRLIRPLAGPFTIAAAVWIAAQHLLGGVFLVGQRDVFMLLPILGAGLLMVRMSGSESQGLMEPLAAGALLGIAAMMKPTAVLYAPLLTIVVVWGTPKLWTIRRMLRLGGVLIAGFAIPCLAVAAALLLQGTLGQFIGLWRDYLLPVYGKIRATPVELIVPLLGTTMALAAFGLIAALRGVRLKPDIRLVLLAAILVAALLGYLAQGKGWVYQAAPYNYAAILMTVAVARAIWQAGAEPRRLVALIVPFLALPLVFATGKDAVREVAAMASGSRTPAPFVADLIGDLDRIDPSRKLPVQAFDTTYGVLDALLRSDRHQPTRFIYDFQFYIGDGSALRATLRREFLSKLASAGPHLFVVTNQQWPGRHGFDRVDDRSLWPELNALLTRHYTIIAERKTGRGDGRQYRIYRYSP